MKVVLLILFSFLFLNPVNAEDKISATLSKCVDGDTAYFMVDGEERKVRFLALDTPESTNEIEPFGKEASEYTCNALKNANKIELKKDKNSDEIDKYDRYLYWVFVDDELLQKKIIENGLGQVDYLYDDYEYTTILEASETKAKLNKIGMWEESDYTSTIIIISFIVIIIIIICIFNEKFRKKVLKKVEKNIEKELKKQLKKL